MSDSRGSSFAVLGPMCVAIAIYSAPAPALVVTVHRMLEVTEVDEEITAIEVGDRFIIHYVLNDAATDTQPSAFTGIFPGLVTSFTMTRHSTSTGTWIPSGTFDLGPNASFSTSAPGDSINFRVPGTGFPNGGTDLLFEDLDLNWNWPSGISDSGSGQSFAQQLAPIAFHVPPAVFNGNGITFEYDDDPGMLYYADTIDVTIFVDGFETNSVIWWSDIQP
jgi:hypothetical protein